ncbi:MAG: response regulator [Adhaeribacter sp.]
MNLKAFLIDDDQICHFITQHILKTEALATEIHCFYEAEKAFESLISAPAGQLPGLIFLDLNMPGMNGWQFLEALRPHASLICRHSQIYILTSSVDKEDQQKALEYPFVHGYFLKPLQAPDLQAIRAGLPNPGQPC